MERLQRQCEAAEAALDEATVALEQELSLRVDEVQAKNEYIE